MAFVEQIKIGIRQIERWLIAARQDMHPGIKLLHANYAVGDIDMLRQMFTDEEIAAATNKDINELYKDAMQLQDAAQRSIIARCPEAAPE